MSTDETLIDLMRHGETTHTGCYCGSKDVSLTANGREQMERVLYQKLNCDRIISSPLSRCAEVANSFSRQRNIPLNIDADFQEIHFGDWEGQAISDIFKDHPKAINSFFLDPIRNTPPKGESLRDFHDRVIKAFVRCILQYRGQRLLILTHGGVIRVVVAHVLGMPLNKLMKLEVPHASLSRIRVYHDNAEDYNTSLVFHSRR